LIADAKGRAAMDAGVRSVTRDLPPTFELPYVAVAYRMTTR
jgi:hypothetical protein